MQLMSLLPPPCLRTQPARVASSFSQHCTAITMPLISVTEASVTHELAGDLLEPPSITSTGVNGVGAAIGEAVVGGEVGASVGTTLVDTLGGAGEALGDALRGGKVRVPQSRQSVPKLQWSNSAPRPPSSHSSSAQLVHVLSQIATPVGVVGETLCDALGDGLGDAIGGTVGDVVEVVGDAVGDALGRSHPIVRPLFAPVYDG